jgi:RNA polymerase sigma-70 factor (ECF subfamily)
MRNVTSNSGSNILAGLLERVGLERDQSAFNELYAATKGRLFLTAVRIVRRGHMAEEIVQEGYSRIWLNADSYRASLGSPMNWMITIIRNLSIDILKKSAREIYSDDTGLMELTADAPTALEAIEADEERMIAVQQTQNVFSALYALDPIKRDLVIAAYILGESREQLSKKAGVPVNTVKTWIRRTLLEVKEILRNTESDAGHFFADWRSPEFHAGARNFGEPATNATDNGIGRS